MRKRALLVFAASFGTVLLAGAAFAQVGVFSPRPPDQATASDVAADEPQAPRYEEPKEEPALSETEADLSEPDLLEAEEEATHTEPVHEPTEAEEPAEPSEEAIHDVWIEILHPKPEQVVSDEYLVFEGHVSADTRVFRGKYEAEVTYLEGEGLGVWRLALVLSVGEQRVTFEAVGPDGESATDSVVVIYQPVASEEEPKEEPKEEPGTYDFTAHQKYGTCGEAPPYDVFYGTGQPGTKVWIESVHGGASTTIGELGHWDLKVTFYEAPCNEEFDVILETDAGDRREFRFVRVCEEGGADK